MPAINPRIAPDWLACPSCHAPLDGAPRLCACGRSWASTHDVPDLVPASFETAEWASRLNSSRTYHSELVADPEGAALAFRSDLQMFAGELSACHGVVIDVGGGHGLARDFLPSDVSYASIDPDLAWLDSDWDVLATEFPSLVEPLDFVRGVAEALPCCDAAVDVVLTVFALNHCADPAVACREVARVLRPGGEWLLVLEDVEPSWADTLSGRYRDWRGWSRSRLVGQKLLARVNGWPMESDHIRISERDILQWTCGDLSVVAREWRGPYRMIRARRV